LVPETENLQIGADGQPVPLFVLIGGTLAATAFCIYAMASQDGFLFPDHANLAFHEFGHIFFGLFGSMIGFWGGTLMQLGVPLGILIYFLMKKERAGVFFCLFWFGENMLNIAVYMHDARSLALPLVGGGEHDWNVILGHMKLLRHDQSIAAAVRDCGWFIMVASIVWFLAAGVKSRR
jgi:hypothetical protein